MKSSTKEIIKGGIHEVRGTIKEQVGKITDNSELKLEGNVEKNSGKMQQQIGHAKGTVEKLQGMLTQVKNTENEN